MLQEHEIIVNKLCRRKYKYTAAADLDNIDNAFGTEILEQLDGKIIFGRELKEKEFLLYIWNS